MTIIIFTSKTAASIEIVGLEKISWQNDYNLSRLILINLDDLLKKHNLSLDDIDNFEFKNEESAGFTTSRIAETTVNVLNFAKK